MKQSLHKHEMAHVLLLQPYHRPGEKRPKLREWPSHTVCEAEADATAFVVTGVLGYPSNVPT